MSESVTIPSDSENYDGNNELSSSPPSSSSSPVILYHPPTMWGLVRGAAINLVLPFVNGLMLGFGELFAQEIAFRLGWSGTKVSPKPAPQTPRRLLHFAPCRVFGARNIRSYALGVIRSSLACAHIATGLPRAPVQHPASRPRRTDANRPGPQAETEW